ncbi:MULTISPECIES: regulatory protein RecX [unclassified Diaminobutyricimonas]|uniref:regulatory protein RecX n=1 Tax=unclassified Diaminobutyricimonas TaxID=2643261 RepID=UPI0012F4C1E2|nr:MULTISPECIES: regulatory protein RecX [unclassified Diaminobutyricimonas]
MTGRDGLARVTWLPGARPADEVPADEVPAVAGADVSEDGAWNEPEFDQASIERISMQALTRRGVSSREMHKLLVARGVDSDAASDEVARLERVALLDDAALAETLVRTLTERKGLGRSALSAELSRRLLDPVAVESALAALDGGDEAARARALALKRAPQLRSLDHEVAVRRLSAFLMRKGYSGAIVRGAVDAALGGRGGRSGPGGRTGVRFE